MTTQPEPTANDAAAQFAEELQRIKDGIELSTYKMAVTSYHDAFDGINHALLIGMSHPAEALQAIAMITAAVEPIVNTLTREDPA